MPNQWSFTSATLNHIRFVFYHNIKDNERNLSQDLLTIENTKRPTRTWKCTRCIMQMSYLYASDFPFKNFCKLPQHGETIRKKMFKSTDHDKPQFHSYVFMFFLPQYQRQRKCVFFQSASWKRHCATHWREQRGMDSSNFWLVCSEHAHASYPGLSFRPPGFSPYRGREERRVQGLDYMWHRRCAKIIFDRNSAVSLHCCDWLGISSCRNVWSWLLASFRVRDRKYLSVGFIFRISEVLRDW